MTFNRKLLFLFLAPLLGLALVSVEVAYKLYFWRYQGPETVFQVAPGERFTSIKERLSEEKIISGQRLFHHLCRYQQTLNKFRAGPYKITTGMNMVEVMNQLVYGKPLTIALTIPEGKNMFEIAQLLEAQGITKAQDFLREARNESFLRSLGFPYASIEGYLYPDTYQFTPGQSGQQVIKTMTKTFLKKTELLDFDKASLGGRHQVVILASIVEKETGAKEEREMISGVFHNRLKKKMRLQSDPTTIYGIFETFDGNLRRSDLLQVTPYNTYKINGLPIGPISNPGLDSLKAALWPKGHDFYFFVSQNDGKHIFTHSYKDHQKAVQDFQVNAANREGKSWRQLKQ